MKQRIISAGIGLVILFTVLYFYGTPVANVAVALISMIGVWELLHATGCMVSKTLCAIATAFSLLIPFLSFSFAANHLAFICYVYVLALFVILLGRHSRLHVHQLALAFTFSLLVPFSLTTVIYARDVFGTTRGIFYALVIFGSAWLSDSGAYFAGRFLGKHKLAPIISPKKTVEGAIGGAVAATVLLPLVLWIYSLIVGYFDQPLTIYYLRLICCTPLFSAVSVLGDLSASVIKRQFQVKDYGSIMPGHGGVMDRFDSVLMVAPLVYLLSRYLPLVG